VLILKPDRDAAAAIAQRIHRALPAAECRFARGVAEARACFAAMRIDRVIAGLGAADGDVIDLLGCGLGNAPASPRCLVVT
jgi:hypothetical protein